MNVRDVRRHFLEYFRKNGHAIVESSPLVPRNDPTLMFTNAGMVQFKNVFTGIETRSYARAATSQKCVRAGGMHNDLENVGYTARHHTFFEMLGNFSFGDYFKERAIELAWNLLTKDYGLAKDKLLVTVYHTDDEAAGFWKKIAGLSDDRIIRIPTADNFWAMGETGPCGPCTEIFYDYGEGIPGGPPGSLNGYGDRFIAIWNLLFMQYEQYTKETRLPLPKSLISTGIGLERLAAVLQGKHDNYDIDLFRALIEAVANETGVDPDGPQSVSHKVIADHLRTTAFLIADGVLPSNEGRGYVLRRIMRRAMRHAYGLGGMDPIIWKLVPSLVKEMGDAFPELMRAQPLISETLKLEETHFARTLGAGLKLLENETGNLSADGKFRGDVTFKLYDTFGFPPDLTQDVLRTRDIKVDYEGFEAAMDEQRAKARAAWVGLSDTADQAIWFDIRQKAGATEFLGYDTERAEGEIKAIVIDGKEVPYLKAGQTGWILANQTPFYAESGGQQGDTGQLASGANSASVSDVQKMVGDLHTHHATVEKGELKVGDDLVMTIDPIRRAQLRAYHSATHLLHEALRRHLGEHVTQKGSLVAPDRLRFDISHTKPVSAAELRKIEDEVNDRIRHNSAVETRLMTPDEAIAAGAMALFGEKYGEEVRVLSMGGDSEEKYSVELCGGTHVRRTGEIGLFKIVGEGAVSSGVRRIEALAGAAAEAHVRHQANLLAEAAAVLRVPPQDLQARLTALSEGHRKAEKELSEIRLALARVPPPGDSIPQDILPPQFGTPVVAAQEPTQEREESKESNGEISDSVPPQGVGPHFAIAGGRVTFANPSSIDAAGNNLELIEKLLPLLREAAKDVVSEFGALNIPHALIHRLSLQYEERVSRKVEEIPFTELFGYGLRLENALAASGRSTSSDEDKVPPLTNSQAEAIRSLLGLHGPFIFASSEGQALIDAALTYQRRPREEKQFREAAVEFGHVLERHPEIIDPNVAIFIRESAEATGIGPHAERAAIFGRAAVRNVLIVLTAGATLAFASASIHQGIGGILGAGVALFTIEGIKRSQLGTAITSRIAKMIDGDRERTSDQLSHSEEALTASRFAVFLASNAALIRKVAGRRPEFSWVHKWIRLARGQSVPNLDKSDSANLRVSVGGKEYVLVVRSQDQLRALERARARNIEFAKRDNADYVTFVLSSWLSRYPTMEQARRDFSESSPGAVVESDAALLQGVFDRALESYKRDLQ